MARETTGDSRKGCPCIRDDDTERMRDMLNQIVLMGRLTRDPEIRHTQQGVPVASFALAVERDFTNQGGEREADFIDIVAWRSTAEFVGKYFKKGQLAAVSGRLRIRGWTDNDGNKRRSAEVVADNIYFAGGPSQSAKQTAPPEGEPRGTEGDALSGAARQLSRGESQEPAGFTELDEDDGDLPF